MAKQQRMLIIGAGIIGASIAWHLARQGAHVTVIDADEPGGVATRASWGWINASWANSMRYFHLRIQAMEEWRSLKRELPEASVAWCGGLVWDLPPTELEAFALERASWGYGIRRVDRQEAQLLEPKLRNPPEFALHVAAEGAAESLATAQALLTAARTKGAIVFSKLYARSLIFQSGCVRGVTTDTGPIDADRGNHCRRSRNSRAGSYCWGHGPYVGVTRSPGRYQAARKGSQWSRGMAPLPPIYVRPPKGAWCKVAPTSMVH